MGFIAQLLGRNKMQSVKIVLLGASGAGKTTFIRYLESGKPVEEEPLSTLGIDVRRKPIYLDNWRLTTIDVGGQELYQKTFWNLGLNQAHALIYIIDGTIRPKDENENFELSFFSFEYMLELLSPDKPILILINKQDLVDQNPLTTSEAIKLYNIMSLTGRSMNVLPSSAKYGTGVNIAIKWIFTKVSNGKYTGNPKIEYKKW